MIILAQLGAKGITVGLIKCIEQKKVEIKRYEALLLLGYKECLGDDNMLQRQQIEPH
jgi:hypothetical protein